MMKQMKRWMTMVILAVCGVNVFFIACKGTAESYPHVLGTLDGPLLVDSAPANVLAAMEKAERFHQYEIMNDTVNEVSVWSLQEVDTSSTEGYGIVIVKGATSTTFPHVRNVRQPLGSYDRASNTLWLAASAMEGTGVAVERLYQIRFDGDGKASIERTFDPFDLQQQLCQRVGYHIEGQQITFYNGQRLLATATSAVTDRGDFDGEHPLWIGEQMQYDLSGDAPRLLITPGVKHVEGPVLDYVDMPTFCAPLTIEADGQISIGDLEIVEHPYEGTYLDQDNNEPNLFISYRRNDGKYDVQIGIFRLTSLDDGIGTIGDDGLSFVATDAAGNPIGGVITLSGDTAEVTFNNTTWELLEPGSQFIYVRQE